MVASLPSSGELVKGVVSDVGTSTGQITLFYTEEAVVDRMRKDITLELKELQRQVYGRDGTFGFKVSYRGRDPEVLLDAGRGEGEDVGHRVDGLDRCAAARRGRDEWHH